MTTSSSPPSYKGYRFPSEIISSTVWLYYRFSLSYRDVEELMAARGIGLSYETIRQWCRKFGQQYAKQVRRHRPQTGDKWHLDEVFLQSRANSSICGGPLISTAICWISWSRVDATKLPRKDSSASYSKGLSMSHVS